MSVRTTACPERMLRIPVRTCMVRAVISRVDGRPEAGASAGNVCGGNTRTRGLAAPRACGCGWHSRTRSSRTRARETAGAVRRFVRSPQLSSLLREGTTAGSGECAAAASSRHQQVRVQLEHELLHRLCLAQRALHPHEGVRHAQLLQERESLWRPTWCEDRRCS